jgi:hypothetical protein
MRMSLRSKVTTLQKQAIKRLIRSENDKTVNRAINKKNIKRIKKKNL